MDITEILDGHVYLSSWGAAASWDTLRMFNITHVLSLTPDYPCKFPDWITYLHHPVDDHPSTNLIEFFPKAFEFIDDAKAKSGGVLVHCNAGVSRSPTVVIAYVMKSLQTPLSEAIECVRSKRSCAYPNQGFMDQLRLYETHLFGRSSVSDMDAKVQDMKYIL